MADFKRQTAYKIRIGDIFKGKPIMDNNRLTFIELGDRILIGRYWVKGETIEKEIRGTNAVDLELKRIFGPNVKIRMMYAICDYKNNKMILR